MKHIFQIKAIGPPASGKTHALNKIKIFLENEGYEAIVNVEVEEELIVSWKDKT